MFVDSIKLRLIKMEAAHSTSYSMIFIAGFWFDMYLRDRRPVVLNHNPFMSFNPPPTAQLKDPVRFYIGLPVAGLTLKCPYNLLFYCFFDTFYAKRLSSIPLSMSSDCL